MRERERERGGGKQERRVIEREREKNELIKASLVCKLATLRASTEGSRGIEHDT